MHITLCIFNNHTFSYAEIYYSIYMHISRNISVIYTYKYYEYIYIYLFIHIQNIDSLRSNSHHSLPLSVRQILSCVTQEEPLDVLGMEEEVLLRLTLFQPGSLISDRNSSGENLFSKCFWCFFWFQFEKHQVRCGESSWGANVT